MQVLFLSAGLQFPHGMAATRRAYLLAKGLVQQGHTVTVVSIRASEAEPLVLNSRRVGVAEGIRFAYTSSSPVRPSRFSARRLDDAYGFLNGMRHVARLVRENRVDLVYSWFTSQVLQLPRLCFVTALDALGVPVFFELNERPWTLRPDARVIERAMSPIAGMSGTVAISHLLEDWALSEARRTKRVLSVIRVPIVCDPAESAESAPADGDQYVLYAASSAYESSLRFVLESMRLVRRVYPHCRLDVTGVSADALTGLVDAGTAEAISAGRVRLRGYVPRRRLVGFYRSASALLCPLWDDVVSKARFPTKIAEYAMSGAPIVATRVGEVDFYFQDGQTAFLAEAGEPQAFAEKICEVLSDGDRARDVGSAGRVMAEREFDYRTQSARLAESFATTPK